MPVQQANILGVGLRYIIRRNEFPPAKAATLVKPKRSTKEIEDLRDNGEIEALPANNALHGYVIVAEWYSDLTKKKREGWGLISTTPIAAQQPALKADEELPAAPPQVEKAE